MMFIQFRDKWRLGTTDGQWKLERKKTPKKADAKNKWVTVGYFVDPRRAVVASFKLQVTDPGEYPTDDLRAVLDKLDEIYHAFDTTLEQLDGIAK